MKLSKPAFVILAAASIAMQSSPCVSAATGAVEVSETAPTNPDGESALATERYPQAETVYRAFVGNAPKGSPAEMYGRICLGESLLWQGKTGEANKEFRRAQSLASKVANDELTSRLNDDLAWLYEAQGDLAAALQTSESTTATLRAKQKPNFAAVESAEHTGYIADMLGQLDKASHYYRESLAGIPEGKAVLFRADTEQRLASVLWRLGQADAARQLYQKALSAEMQMNAPLTAYQPHPYWGNVTFRYQPGAPNAGMVAAAGKTRQVISANGVVVEMSAPESAEAGKAVRVDVAVKNDSNQTVQFLSQAPSLSVLQPKAVEAHLINPEQLANDVEKKGEKDAKWIRWWGGDATMPVTTTIVEPRRYYYGYGTNVPIYSTGIGAPIINRNGNITTITQQVPDYAAQARALQKAADAIETSQQKAQSIRARMLGPTTIAPGAVATGSLYFDVKDARKSVVRLPIGNAIFEFEFPAKS